MRYSQKIFGLLDLVERVHDRRRRPRIPTSVVVRSALVMILARLGSLNALEQTTSHGFWRRWLGAALPSADSIGRIMELVEASTLRAVNAALYRQLKINKALPPTSHGLMALVIDGHESHATYHRCCSGCRKRQVSTRDGSRTQYYHRHVTAMLLGEGLPFLLDAEPQQPGEGELPAAMRLMRRVLRQYPRAFDVVLGDALYTNAPFYRLMLRHGKDVLTVLKDSSPALLREAQDLLKQTSATVFQHGKTRREVRDLADLEPWPKLQRPIRVVKSQEQTRRRRQLDGSIETRRSEWLWAMTLSPHRASSEAVVRLAHARWDIENRAFNEAVNRWHADHVYKHAANAMLTFWLLTLVAINLFRAFYHRNLRPELTRATSYLHVARRITADVYHDVPLPHARPP